MTRNHPASVFFLALFLGIFLQTAVIFSPFIPVIFWAALLAFGFYPLYQTFLRRLRCGENLAALVTMLCILLAVAPLSLVVVFHLSAEVTGLIQKIADFVTEGHLKELFQKVYSLPVVKSLEDRIFSSRFLERNLDEWTLNLTRSLGNFTLHQFGVISRNIFYFVLGFLVTMLLVYALLRHGQNINQFIYEITPLEENDKKAIFHQVKETLSAAIHGQIVGALAQSVSAGLVFYFLNLPVPLFIAAATFLSSMIPVVGASIVWVPFVVYLAVTQHYAKALLLLLLGTLVISAIDNILKPAIIGEKTKLPYSLLFLAILGGMKVYGFMGIFVAPVVLSLFFALIKIYREKYLIKS